MGEKRQCNKSNKYQKTIFGFLRQSIESFEETTLNPVEKFELTSTKDPTIIFPNTTPLPIKCPAECQRAAKNGKCPKYCQHHVGNLECCAPKCPPKCTNKCQDGCSSSQSKCSIPVVKECHFVPGCCTEQFTEVFTHNFVAIANERINNILK